MIPSVKLWLVKVRFADERGTVVYHVYAPTKVLARLNLRHDSPETWSGEILSIGVTRKR